MEEPLSQQFWRRGGAAALAAAALALALTCAVTSARWIDAPFPGFFIMANRVVASVSLPHWPITVRSWVYQQEVVAVNEQPVSTSAEVYAAVGRLPVGTAVTYTLQQDGRVTHATFPSSIFTREDYTLLFVAYLLNGLALALIGIGAWFLKPDDPASRALFIGGLASGLFTLTAADLYAPYWFFRLHVVGEAFFPAAFTHLALVFPVDRLRRHRALWVSAPYVIALFLSVAYELSLYHPPAYSFVHGLCMLYVGASAVIFFSRIVWDYSTTDSHLVHQRIRVILIGFLGGFAFPAVLMFASGVTGGQVAVNAAAFTAFLFPLSVGYAIVRHDLFEIDTVLKRAVYYLTLTAVLTGVYLLLLSLLNFTLYTAAVSRSPLFPLFFTLIVVLLFNPLKDYLQRGVDLIFFRSRYDPQKVLERTSASLATTLRLDEILSLLWHTISETMGVQQGGIFLPARNGTHYVSVYPRTGDERRLSATHPLVQELRRGGRVFSVYDVVDGGPQYEAQEELRSAFFRFDVFLMVPLIFKNDLVGIIAVGRKESGRFFTAGDRDFLVTLANQGALSLANAVSYQEIQMLNAGLERKVTERTHELAYANKELHNSLKRLEQAYRDLQSSQEHLLRAEKMAALGRLTAGVAHEINTPLGASLTSLKLIHELIEEYRASIGDPQVNERDHHDIAAEMDKLTSVTQQWMEKAAAHIRSLKLHTRDPQPTEERVFSVREVIEDASLLLSHRLRLSLCTLHISSPTTEPVLRGDPSKLSQVLTNIVVNAIDAYMMVGRDGGEVRIEVSEQSDSVKIHVKDQGCGIPPEQVEKIFDEFFSTKPFGEGTGLGLSIAQGIMANFFGGTITVESVVGRGSVFTLHCPHRNNTVVLPSISMQKPTLKDRILRTTVHDG